MAGAALRGAIGRSVDGLEGIQHVVNKPGPAYQQAPLCSHCSKNMAGSLLLNI